MSSKRRLRRRTCTKKQAYKTREEADLACERTRQVNRERGRPDWPGGDTIRSYQCARCGRWHLGHVADKARNRD